MSTYKYLDLTGLSRFWGKIKAKFTVYYGSCSTSASTQTKVVTCSDFTLVTGARIDVKFDNAQSYSPSDDNPVKLNINSTGAKAVMRHGTTILPRYAWQSGEIVRFVYDGTNYIAVNNALATTTYYGRTKLSSSVSSTSTSVASTPSAVKQAYDLATQADTQATTNTNKISELDKYLTGTRSDSTGAVNFCLLYVSLNRTLVSGLKVHVYCPSDAFVETRGEWLMPLSFSIDNQTTYIEVLGANGETITGQDAVGRYLELYYNGTNWIAISYGNPGNYSIGGNLAVTGTVTSTGGFTGDLSGNATTSTNATHSTSSDSAIYSNKAKELDNYYTANTRPTSANLTADGSGGLRTFKATSSMTTGKPPDDSHIIHLSWDNTNGYDSQIAVKNGDSPKIWLRGMAGGTWGSWTELQKVSDTGWVTITLGSNNYLSARSGADYAPKYRKIGNVVYLQGQLKVTSAMNAKTNYTISLSNIPTPAYQTSFVTGNYGGVVANAWISGTTLAIRPYGAVSTEDVGFQIDTCYITS